MGSERLTGIWTYLSFFRAARAPSQKGFQSFAGTMPYSSRSFCRRAMVESPKLASAIFTISPGFFATISRMASGVVWKRARRWSSATGASVSAAYSSDMAWFFLAVKSRTTRL